jgi:hypothetical protein
MNTFTIVYAALLALLLLGIGGFSVFTTIRLIRQGNKYKHRHRRK